jgi:hypothetical protein
VGYGHVHRPFVRRAACEPLVANARSVGMPWDGDPRASYLLVDGDTARIVRVAYDVDREQTAMSAARHPDAARSMPCAVAAASPHRGRRAHDAETDRLRP